MPRIAASGWSVSLTHPQSGRVIRPDVIDPRDVQYNPGPNTLPRIRIPVRKAPEWLTEQFDNNPTMSVHLDGDELPIDELVNVEQPEGRTLLVGEGGAELRTRIQREYDAEERPQAAVNLVDTETTYDTVDRTPASSEVTNTVQSPSGESELSQNITLADTDPFVFTGGGVKPSKTCITTEGENYTSSQNEISFLETYYSNGEARGFTGLSSASGDFIEWQFSTDHAIPEAYVDVAVRDGGGSGTTINDSVGFTWYLNNNQIDTLSEGVGLALGWTDVGDGSYNGNGWTGGDLPAGTHTLKVEFDNATADGQQYTVDVVAPYDSRYTYNFDDTLNADNGYLDGPELYPGSVNSEFDAYESAFSVVAGEASVTATDPLDLALSNDQGSTYPITATDASTVSGTFTTAGAYLNLRATLDRKSPNGAQNQTPRYGYDAERLDAYTLDATIEFESLLIDQEFDDQLYRALGGILGEQFAWAVQIINNTTTVVIDEPGNTVASRDPDISAQQIDKRLKTYEKVVIRGSSLPVSGETFQASTTFQALNNDNIVTGSEAVYDDTGTQYVRGTDYEIDYSDGEIKALSGGSLTTTTEYNIDYRHRAIGSHTVSGATGDTLVRTVPGVVTDRQAEQIAFVLAEVEPNLAVPRYEGDIVVPRVDSTFDPLEALTLADSDLPDAATPLSIRGEPELTPLGLRLRLGSAPRLEAALSDIAEQVAAVSDRV